MLQIYCSKVRFVISIIALDKTTTNAARETCS